MYREKEIKRVQERRVKKENRDRGKGREQKETREVVLGERETKKITYMSQNRDVKNTEISKSMG